MLNYSPALSPKTKPLQGVFGAPRHPGITHDCFLDCGKAMTFTEPELPSAISRGCASGVFLARVADEVAARAITLINGQRDSIARALRA
jgi:hypothetical protein